MVLKTPHYFSCIFLCNVLCRGSKLLQSWKLSYNRTTSSSRQMWQCQNVPHSHFLAHPFGTPAKAHDYSRLDNLYLLSHNFCILVYMSIGELISCLVVIDKELVGISQINAISIGYQSLYEQIHHFATSRILSMLQ